MESHEKSPRTWLDALYETYIVGVLLLASMCSQLDRYLLPVCSKAMAQDIGYGDQVCVGNVSWVNDTCATFSEQEDCENASHAIGRVGCDWQYSGIGHQYSLLVGPVYVIVYTLVGIGLAIIGDYTNRQKLLTACILLWSACTVFTGTSHEFWQLALMRFLMGMGEASCTPLSTSLIGDYFNPGHLATALGVYSFSLYGGIGLAYGVGNFAMDADRWNQGWRWAFYYSGIFGLLPAVLVYFTVKESRLDILPEAAGTKEPGVTASGSRPKIPLTGAPSLGQLQTTCRFFLSPPLLMVCMAGSIRHMGGFIWNSSSESYFLLRGGSAGEIGTFLSWVPVVGGGIGAIIGGLLADRITVRLGPIARPIVIAGSLFAAFPFCVCTLLIDQPGAYITLLVAYMIGEVWFGVTLAATIEMVPPSIRSSAIAFYMFVISNAAAIGSMMVTPIQQAFSELGLSYQLSLQYTLLVLWPGSYFLAAILYLLAVVVMQDEYPAIYTKNPYAAEEREPLRAKLRKVLPCCKNSIAQARRRLIEFFKED